MAFKQIIEEHPKLMELVRFGIVGVISTLTTYAVYYVCLSVLNANVSFAIGYAVALVVNYLLTTAFTFKVKANKKNGVGFLISNLINYLLCTLFLNIFIWLGVDKKWAPIPMYAICIPINFLLVRFVMKRGKEASVK